MNNELYEQTCLELDLPLEEAGGLFSLAKRFFAGYDGSVADEIRHDMQNLRSEEQRQELLRMLDMLIEEGDIVIQRGAGRHLLGAVIGAAGLGVAVGALTGKLGTAAKLAGWLPLGGPGGMVNTELVDNAMSIGGLFLRGASGLALGFVVVRILVNLIRLVNLRNGTIEDYVRTLRTLRAEVSAVKLKM